MKKILSFCFLSVLLAFVCTSVKAQVGSGLALDPPNLPASFEANVADTFYISPAGPCFSALGLADGDSISIEWRILKDGVQIPDGELSSHFNTFKFESRYDIGSAEMWWGTAYTSEYCNDGNGYGSFPGANTPIVGNHRECERTGNFAITLPGQNNPYEFDYFTVRFFKESSHRLVINPKEAGNYTFILEIYKRRNGSNWELFTMGNDPRFYVGGHGSEAYQLVSSDTLRQVQYNDLGDITICVGTSFVYGNPPVAFDQRGQHEAYFYSNPGCSSAIDSIVSFYLIIETPETPVMGTGNVLQLCDEGDAVFAAVPQQAGDNGQIIWKDANNNVIDTTDGTLTLHITSNTTVHAYSYNPNSGCVSLDSLEIKAEVYSSPSFAVSTNAPICADNELKVWIDNRFTSHEWTFNGTAVGTDTVYSVTDAQPENSGWYFVVANEEHTHAVYATTITCSTTDSVEVKVYARPTAVINTFNGVAYNAQNVVVADPVCPKDTGTVVVAAITAVDGAIDLTSIVWSSGAAGSLTDNFTVASFCGITYKDTLTYAIDANGCTLKNQATIAFTVNDTEAPVITNAPTEVVAAPNMGGCKFKVPDLTTEVTATDNCDSLVFSQNITADSLIERDTVVVVTVADMCGNTTTAAITVKVAPALEIANVDVTDVYCPNDSTGKIAATIAGGTAGYALTLSDNNSTRQFTTTANTTEDAVIFDNLWVSTWKLTVTDANGCTTEQDAIEITSTDNTAPVVTALADTVYAVPALGCKYTVPELRTNDYIEVEERCTHDTAQTPAAGTTITDGTDVVITSTDNSNNSGSATIYVKIPAQVAVEATDVVAVLCEGNNNGEIEVTVSNGFAQYQIEATHATAPAKDTTLAAAGTARFKGLVSGEWTITVTDSNECQTSITVDVTSPNKLELTAAGTNLSCYESNDGAIEYEVSGGSVPYTIVISKGTEEIANETEASKTIANLVADSYVVTVTDNNGCEITKTITLTQPDMLSVENVVVVNNVDCNGNATGNAAPVVTGGTYPYAYTWTNAENNTVSTDSLTGRILAAGEYTVVATDDHGCTASGNVTITEPAALAATITLPASNCPEVLDFNFAAAIQGGSANYKYTWTVDGIEISVKENVADLTDACTLTTTLDCNHVYDITFTVKDDSACVLTLDTTFFVVDTIKPTIEGTIADTVVANCIVAGAVPTYTTVAAFAAAFGLNISDNCTTDAADLELTFSDESVATECPFKFVRTYKVTDKCGNFETISYQIEVTDSLAPTYTRPADITVYREADCSVDTTTAVTGYPTDLDDNCMSVDLLRERLTYTDEDITPEGTCAGNNVIKRTWHLMDGCGNVSKSDSVQIITIEDRIAPQLTLTTDSITVVCSSNRIAELRSQIAAPTNANIIENCSAVTLTIDTTVFPGACVNSFTERYIFTATDACGNSSVDTAFFYVIDTVAPFFDVVPLQKQISCTTTMDEEFNAWMNTLEYHDNCLATENISLVIDTIVTPGTCPVIEEYKVVWTLSDGCNVVKDSSTFTIVDNDVPVFDNIPTQHMYVECDGQGNVQELMDWLASVTATDNCTTPTIKVYYLGTDEEFDTTAYHADGVHFAGWHQDANGCEGYYDFRWEATDGCHNTQSAEERFVIRDLTGPEFAQMQDTTVNCADVTASSLSDWANRIAEATDLCSDATYTVANNAATATFHPQCGATGYYDITWTSTDLCNNVTEKTARYTIIDETAPVIEGADADNYIPNDTLRITTANCTPNLPAFTYTTVGEMIAAGAITGVVDCSTNDNTEISFTYQLLDDASCAKIYLRTYSIEDACGNQATFYQKYVLVDEEAPVLGFTAVADDSIHFNADCSFQTPTVAGFATYADLLAHDANATAQDCNLDNNSEIEFVGTDTTKNGCKWEIVYSYKLHDNCGNSTPFTVKAVITDVTAPAIGGAVADYEWRTDVCNYKTNINNTTIGAPAFATPAEAANNTGLTITDCNIDMNDATRIEVVSTDTNTTDACIIKITRTYQVSDNCGNVSDEFTQVIIVRDTVKPAVAGTLADTTVYYEDPTACVMPNVDLLETLADVRAYAVAHAGSTLAITDCNIAADAVVTLVSADTTGTACNKVVTRKYTVADACGNVSDEFEQVINISDTTRPAIGGQLVDINLNLGADCSVALPAAYTTVAELVANGLTVADCNLDETADRVDSISTVYVPDTDCPKQYVRTYKVSDDCGNASDEFTQNIYFSDVTAPVPSGDIAAFDTVLIDDANECGFVLRPAFTRISEIKAFDPTWSAEDCTISDTCLVELVSTDTNTASHCPLVVTRKYVVYDGCGNVSAPFFHVNNVNDTTRPRVTGDLAAIDLDLPDDCTPVFPAAYRTVAELAAAGLTVEDCNIDVNANRVDSISTEYVLNTYCPRQYKRTYVVNDDCGNPSDEFTQIINFNDVTAPVPSGDIAAFDTVLIDDANNCGFVLRPAFTRISEVKAYDPTWDAEDCTIDDTCFVRLLSEDTSATHCPLVITRNYVVYDACGNESAEFHQINTVRDTTRPHRDGTMATIVVEMDAPNSCALNAPAAYTSVAALNAANTGITISDCNLDDELTSVADTAHIANIGDEFAYVITRTYTAKDSCGNAISFDHIINVKDVYAPSMSDMPKDSVIYLGAATACDTPTVAVFTTIADIEAYPGINGAITVADCQLVDEVVLDSTRISASTCPDIITRYYHIIDSTGNMTEFVQRLILTDTTAPVVEGTLIALDVYSDSTCRYTLPTAYTTIDNLLANGVTAVNDCHAVTITDSADEVTLNADDCEHYVTRSYTISDECGNNTVIEQRINIIDSIKPWFTTTIATAVADAAGNCQFRIPNVVAGFAGTDNCSGVRIEQNPVAGALTTLSYGGTETTEVTVTITDSCDNVNTATVEITLPDQISITNVTTDSLSCYLANDGKITVVAENGIAPYSYYYEIGGNRVESSTGVFEGLAAADYVVGVVDANGCEVEYATSVEVGGPDTLVAVAALNNMVEVCSMNNFDFYGVVNGGTTIYNVTITVDDEQSTTFDTYETDTLYRETFVFENTTGADVEHTFSIAVTDRRGCTASGDTVIVVHPTYEFHDTARVCSAKDYVWVGHAYDGGDTTFYAADMPDNDETYTFYDRKVTENYGCDSVWVLHLRKEDIPFIKIRHLGETDSAAMVERPLQGDVFEAGAPAEATGYEIFVDPNCMPCGSNEKVSLGITWYVYDEDAGEYVEIAENMNDYFAPTYRTYMDRFNLPVTSSSNPTVSIPGIYPSVGQTTATAGRFDFYYLHWLAPNYDMSRLDYTTPQTTPSVQSGTFYSYGRATTVAFSQFRREGRYMMVVALQQRTGGSDRGEAGYLNEECGARIGGNGSVATGVVFDYDTIFFSINGTITEPQPSVNPSEGVNNDVTAVNATVYPNPSNDVVNVELSGFEGETSVMMRNSDGRTVYATNIDIDSDSTPIVRINVDGMAQGVYMITARSNDAIVTKRVVVIR